MAKTCSVVVSKANVQCTNMEFASTACNTYEVEKNRKTLMLKLISVHDIYFFFSLQ